LPFYGTFFAPSKTQNGIFSSFSSLGKRVWGEENPQLIPLPTASLPNFFCLHSPKNLKPVPPSSSSRRNSTTISQKFHKFRKKVKMTSTFV